MASEQNKESIMKNDDIKFDLQIRSIMNRAEEEVPQMVWEAVEKSLDKPAVHRGPIFWISRVGASVAAAAAIVAGIFFGMDTVPSTQPDTLSTLIQTETSTPSQESTTYFAKATAAQTAAFVAPSPAPQEESVIAADETATPSATPQQETTQIVEEQEGEINIVKYEGPEQANLYAEAFETPEDKAKRRKIELVVSGNASDGPQEQLIFNRPMYVQSATAPTKTGITETGPSDYSIPVTLGAGVKFSLTEKWALGAGLSYTIAGREFAGIYTKIKSGSEPFRESFSKIRNTQNYIGLNANAYYSFININWLDFYAYGGFGADKCISNHFQMFDKTNKYTYKDSTGGIQFSVKLGVGVEFLVSDFIGIYLDPSVSYYIPNASMPKSLRTKNPFLPAAEIGLRFKL